MGHSIDSLDYDKSWRMVQAYMEEYRKAVLWLNVLSEDSDTVPREDYDDLQQRQETAIENLQARLCREATERAVQGR